MMRLAVTIVLAAAVWAQERPPITGVAHIALKVKDLGAARAFYGKYLGYGEVAVPGGQDEAAVFPVGLRQYIEVTPDLKSETEDRLSHIAFVTTDVKRMRAYLTGKGVAVQEAQCRVPRGKAIEIRDPDGHRIQFVEYAADELVPEAPARISPRIGHVGFTIADREGADRLYRDILGLHEVWHGGMTDDGPTNWVAMRVPNGMDHLEYMLNVHNPSPRTLGVMNHLCLVVDSVDASYQTLLKRERKIADPPKIGRDGKWQLNLYDDDLTRTELMEPKPVRKPCCSPYLEN